MTDLRPHDGLRGIFTKLPIFSLHRGLGKKESRSVIPSFIRHGQRGGAAIRLTCYWFLLVQFGGRKGEKISQTERVQA